ncbi:DUF6153 family protein [Streptomyces sp. NPDC021749]|uniref:DUF6153 family protein n=1 Tax=Streptomyces sp. NPDC021749 TaxID=3154905 RepID=UPI0034091E37
MSIREHASAPQPRLRLKVLLVLTVLAGLLGMHGLANTGAPPTAPSRPHAAHQHGQTMVRAAAVAHHAGRHACPGHGEHAWQGHGEHADDGARNSGGGKGHTHHADPTCASGALPGAVVLPALPASLTGAADHAVPLAGRLADGTTGARSPPSLAQLQVLRL